MLLKNHPNQDQVKFALDIIEHGARIQYDGPRSNFPNSRNLPSSREQPQEVDKFLQEETQAGRISGPFPSPPTNNLRIVPLGVVPKENGKFRITSNYSFPLGSSVNDDVLKLECKLSCFNDAVEMLSRLPPQTQLMKVDVKSAFRLITVHKDDRHLLGMRWRDQYYIDNCLPFGLSSSPPLWERFSRLIHWILTNVARIPHIVHYVDDFLIAVPPGVNPLRVLQLIRNCFSILGVPIQESKLDGPATILHYLGIGLDTNQQLAFITTQKKEKAIKALQYLLRTQQCNVRQAQSVIGTLAFLAKVIPAGTPFLGRLRAVVATAENGVVTIDTCSKLDIKWWLKMLPGWNGLSLFRISGETLKLATDACLEGFGAVFGKHWFAGAWPTELTALARRAKTNSMPFLELAAIVLALTTWGNKLRLMNVELSSDCQPMVEAVNRSYSPQPQILQLLRAITIITLKHNFTLKLKHIPGVTNRAPDLLSRNQISTFQQEFTDMDPQPTPINSQIPKA